MSDENSKELWQWYAGRDEETYQVGPEDSREAVIQEGRDYFDDEGFWIIEATKGSMAEYLPTATEILDGMAERADGDAAFGDDYCDFTGNITAAEEDLNALLRDWYGRHEAIFPTPWKFAESRNKEWIEPQESTQ